MVKGNLISRLHARVETNRNKFMLIDQSTNGTFVLGKDGEEAFVRRDSMQLRGEGLIGGLRSPHELQINPRQVMERLPRWLAARWGVRFEFGSVNRPSDGGPSSVPGRRGSPRCNRD